jgi:triosephosphate isomerase
MARSRPRRSLENVADRVPIQPLTLVPAGAVEPRVVAIEPVAPAPGRIAVLVCEPHAALREALVALLRQEPDLDVDSARQWSEVTHAIRRRPPNVVLLHRRLMGEDERAIATIRSMSPGTAVVLTGMQHGAQFSPSALRWGAQDCSAHAEGAYTGDVSAAMVAEFGARYVIVGHSERRTGHGETDELIVEKVRRVLATGLVPIVCIGENEDERDANETAAVLRRQLLAVSKALPRQLASIVFAYEPVWAIGQGDAATPGLIADMHGFIARTLHFHTGLPETAMRILYGGSVVPRNAGPILAQPGVAGVLVGGASLRPHDFFEICRAAACSADSVEPSPA